MCRQERLVPTIFFLPEYLRHAAVVEQDLIPLRHIVRVESRPEAAIVFESAVRAGNLSAIHERPDLGLDMDC